MTKATPTPDRTETLEEIAERIVREWANSHQVDCAGPGTLARLKSSVLSALLNEQGRCERIVDDAYRRLDVLNAEGAAPMLRVLKAIRKGR